MRVRTASLALLVLTVLGLGLGGGQTTQTPAQAERVVFLAGGLADEDLLTLSATAAAAGPGAVLLLDTPPAPHNRDFLAAFHPARVVPVGTFADGPAGLQRRLGVSTAPPVGW